MNDELTEAVLAWHWCLHLGHAPDSPRPWKGAVADAYYALWREHKKQFFALLYGGIVLSGCDPVC